MKIETPVLRRLGSVPQWRGTARCLDSLEMMCRRAAERARKALELENAAGGAAAGKKLEKKGKMSMKRNAASGAMALAAAFALSVAAVAGAAELNLVSYNVRHCLGMDGKVDPARTGQAVAALDADFAGLQELDCGAQRTSRKDQPALVARAAGMHATFAKAIDMPGPGEYGIAVLSRVKPDSVKRIPLPGPEARVLLLCEFKDCWFGTTHLDSGPMPGEKEPSFLRAADIIRKAVQECAASKPVFLTGDWNATPGSALHRRMTEFLTPLSDPAKNTNANLGRCIDYVMVDSAHAASFKVREARVVLDKLTSDHKPVAVSLEAPFAGPGLPAKEYLWPEGGMPDAQPHQIAALTDVSRAKDFKADAWRRPYVEWRAPAPGSPETRSCMILISGGGYLCQCDVVHVRNWQREFAKLGVVTASLVHRTPRPEGKEFFRSAWEDGQRAVRLVRSEAAQRGFDPERIGVMSMSAGSHLATLLSASSQTPAYAPVDALDEVPCHINWACPFAIAYAVSDGLGIPNTKAGEAPLDTIFKFDAKTAPMCMMHGGLDKYSPLASTLVYRELRKRGIPAEVHLFPDRGHGVFGFGRAVEFMRQMGFLDKPGKPVALMSRYGGDGARAEYVKQPLWPEGAIPDFQEKQCVPYLEWHIPRTLKTKAVQVIWSGGSYQGNSPDSFEVAPARRYLNALGMAVVTVKYRTPRPAAPLKKHVTAWQDAQRAIRIVRSQAAERGLDPNRIGVMGSSAGGHLALMAALSSKTPAYAPIDALDSLPCNVQWGVAVYPAYALTDGAEHHNSTGGNDDSAVAVPEFAFDSASCPILFIHGDADGWASMNSVKVWERLRHNGIQGAVHTLAKCKHCFHRAASPGTGAYTSLERIREFLADKKILK